MLAPTRRVFVAAILSHDLKSSDQVVHASSLNNGSQVNDRSDQCNNGPDKSEQKIESPFDDWRRINEPAQNPGQDVVFIVYDAVQNFFFVQVDDSDKADEEIDDR
jgi:hypothetical protein